jgi:hypothetical protein
MVRVRFIERDNAPEHLKEHLEVNQAAGQAMFGMRGASINSSKLTAHIPLISRWFLPLIVSMQRNGAGSGLPPKIKTLVDIKTSSVNDCAY